MPETDLIDTLKKFGGIFEAYHKTTFECYRHSDKKGDRKVIVDILDAGPSSPGTRFLCVAHNEDGKGTSGNSAATIEEALAVVHWYKLDE
jgi:hypothetical protein